MRLYVSSYARIGSLDGPRVNVLTNTSSKKSLALQLLPGVVSMEAALELV